MCLELDFLEPTSTSACIINKPGALIFVTWALKKRRWLSHIKLIYSINCRL
jgi:hypothetical protein